MTQACGKIREGTGIMLEVADSTRQNHCAKRQWLGRGQEHEAECVSWEHS